MLAVQVEDTRGRPVPGYLIWIVPLDIAAEKQTPAGIPGDKLHQQRTDRSGQARFNLGHGSRLRLASGPGAWIDGGAFTISPGEVAERFARVAALGGMDVSLLDEFDQPITGLTVALRTIGDSYTHAVYHQGTVGPAMTLIEIRDLPVGDDSFSVTHDDYEPVTRELQVLAGAISPLHVVLRPLLGTDSDEG